jgi:hypothetical protein
MTTIIPISQEQIKSYLEWLKHPTGTEFHIPILGCENLSFISLPYPGEKTS